MFEISEDTKAEAVAEMGYLLRDYLADDDFPDREEYLNRAFDKAVDIVKKQFGL